MPISKESPQSGRFSRRRRSGESTGVERSGNDRWEKEKGPCRRGSTMGNRLGPAPVDRRPNREMESRL